MTFTVSSLVVKKTEGVVLRLSDISSVWEVPLSRASASLFHLEVADDQDDLESSKKRST